MNSDSIRNASIPLASSNPGCFAKKKRANRSAKLKQYKLDARREQWLSQVKNKDACKNEVNGGLGTRQGPPVHLEKERGQLKENLEIKMRDINENYGDGSSMNQFSDSKFSSSNSPTSYNSGMLGSNHPGINFTESSSISSSRSSSISSNGCFWGIMSEEEDEDSGDDGCLDDWEAVADALAATNKMQEHSPNSALVPPPLNKHGNTAQSISNSEIASQEIDVLNANLERRDTGHTPQMNCRAWRADDVSRPRCLPHLSKQYSFPLKSERQFGCGRSVWDCKNVQQVPTSCPICCEDLDCTDSNFLPCQCGFRLCLFCHKKILEEDGRCPGCRKHYDHNHVKGEATFDGGSLTYQLARSCSMITRS
ncbi:uncharacterized protein [Primulina eburnea]|uniref:uncharacterized protein n=1 Tax=Primulina eburnea TaxID=1245227 RepID=UPI003C6BEC86